MRYADMRYPELLLAACTCTSTTVGALASATQRLAGTSDVNMSSSTRLRLVQVGPLVPGNQQYEDLGLENSREEKWKKHTSNFTLPDCYVISYLLFLCLFICTALRSHWALPQSAMSTDPNHFDSLNARKHLEDILALGIRHVGSEANEIHATSLIARKVEEIQKSASKEVEIELLIQHPSGHFSIDFPSNMVHFYHNLSNVAVKLKRRGSNPPHALLINAHYDSALGSPAASDDAVSCATMLEVLRALSASPNPFLPHHAIVFLFNGAEETVLQASHGFITQHPWAGQVKAFVNLEAAGVGGKEIVFQTSPDQPWLIQAYASAVPHPSASVIAQEIFQSGIIPSDTDFRIFRDYGHIPGIDMAYFVNGYVYHTE